VSLKVCICIIINVPVIKTSCISIRLKFCWTCRRILYFCFI